MVSPAWRAQAVVNHKALDAVSAEFRKAAAQAASAQTEGAASGQSVMVQLACRLEVFDVLTSQMPLKDLSKSLCRIDVQCESEIGQALAQNVASYQCFMVLRDLVQARQQRCLEQQCQSQDKLQLPASSRKHRMPESGCGMLGRICWPDRRCALTVLFFATFGQDVSPSSEQQVQTAAVAGPAIGCLHIGYSMRQALAAVRCKAPDVEAC